jgi:HEAT repeat protein
MVEGFPPEFLIETRNIVTPRTEGMTSAMSAESLSERWRKFVSQNHIPYHARNGLSIESLKRAFKKRGLPVWFVFNEGFLYPVVLVGDITQNPELRNEGFMKPQELIRDINPANLHEALVYLARQDRNYRFLQLARHYGFMKMDPHKSKEWNRFIDEIESGDWEIREAAVYKALQLSEKDPSAVQAIPYLLQRVQKKEEPQETVRQAAAEVLGIMARKAGEIVAGQIAVQLTQALIEDGPLVSDEAKRSLIKIGYPAVRPLTDGLRSGNSPEILREIIETLGKLGPTAAESNPFLIIHLEQGPPEVSESAKNALIRIGEVIGSDLMTVFKDTKQKDETRKAIGETLLAIGYIEENRDRQDRQISKLMTELKGDSSEVFAWFVQKVFVRIGRPAIPQLLAALAAAELPPHVRKVSLIALGDIAGSWAISSEELPKVMEMLILTLKTNGNFELYEAAWKAMAKIGFPAVPYLITILENEKGNSAVREAAAMAIEGMGSKALPAVQQLVPLLGDESTAVSMHIHRTLSKIGKPAIPVLLENLEKLSEQRRFLSPAVLTLREIALKDQVGQKEAEAAVTILLHLLSREKEPMLNEDLSVALGAFSRLGLRALIGALKNNETMQNAIPFFATLGPAAKEAVPLLREVLQESGEASVHRMIFKVLAQIAPEDRETISLLMAALEDPNKEIQEGAIDALAHIGAPVVPLLLRNLVNAPSVSSESPAWHVLLKMGKTAIDPLIHALDKSNNGPTRLAAVEMLGYIASQAITIDISQRKAISSVFGSIIVDKEEDSRIKGKAFEANETIEVVISKLKLNEKMENIIKSLYDPRKRSELRIYESGTYDRLSDPTSLALTQENFGNRQNVASELRYVDVTFLNAYLIGTRKVTLQAVRHVSQAAQMILPVDLRSRAVAEQLKALLIPYASANVSSLTLSSKSKEIFDWIREAKEGIAPFAYVGDVADRGMTRQLFESADLIVGGNRMGESQKSVHHVVFLVKDRQEEKVLGHDWMHFLKEKYASDPQEANRIQKNVHIRAVDNPLISASNVKTAFVEWLREGRPGIFPMSGQDNPIHANQLPNGELIGKFEEHHGYGTSLLQAALLLLKGPEASHLQRSSKGPYVQQTVNTFHTLTNVFAELVSARRVAVAA